MRASGWWIAAAGLLVVVGLPLVGKWVRRTPQERCTLDGARIDPLYRVRVVDNQDQDHPFCCIRCATLWLSRQKVKPRSVRVTDEATGREIDAAAAWFVRSSVVTMAHTENRIHAFARHADAARHAAAALGSVLPDSERPFP